ncbi:unnamed protein product [Phytomonas sp. EM1]|nr:unnamed protein product [Phytomonas sp. EM1]|eukprot:CCW64880.1 unnamed protein product [Phytomonas sp. isolate EM1]
MWQGLKAHTKQEKYNRISDRKQSTPIEVLCKGLPQQFTAYMNYVRCLRFEDNPNYIYLHRIFRELFEQEGYHVDYVFDWILRRSTGTSYSKTNGGGNNATPKVEEKSQRQPQ